MSNGNITQLTQLQRMVRSIHREVAVRETELQKLSGFLEIRDDGRANIPAAIRLGKEVLTNLMGGPMRQFIDAQYTLLAERNYTAEQKEMGTKLLKDLARHRAQCNFGACAADIRTLKRSRNRWNRELRSRQVPSGQS